MLQSDRQASGHAVAFRMSDGAEVRSTMLFADAAALVAGDARFLEVNRGVVLNMDHVSSVKNTDALMGNGCRLPLRKRDRTALARTIAQHMVSRVGRAYHG